MRRVLRRLLRRRPPTADRVLTTVLFTDIVGSSRHAAEAGDGVWCSLLEAHNSLVRGHLERHGGRELDVAGDGFFASFETPAPAIRCATAICDGVRELGLDVRAGVHAGECGIIDEKPAGLAVHIGARIAAEAAPGEVLVSRTVRDLVVGSGLRFRPRGRRRVAPTADEWELLAAEPAG